MSKRVQEYKHDQLIVRFDPEVCIHAGNCVRGLPEVFDVKKQPWVNVSGAISEAVVEQVKKCPSGALTFERGTGE